MRRMLLITTGGTIASVPTKEGLAPDETNSNIKNALGALVADCEIDICPLFSIDSSNMQPEEWRKIAECVAQKHRAYDGIVITHGTDTMAYTASALTFMLRDLPLPVVLTGSQLHGCDRHARRVCGVRPAGYAGRPGGQGAHDRLQCL